MTDAKLGFASLVLAGVTVLANTWLAHWRIKNDTKMLDKRLSHERAEGARVSAAAAYEKANRLVSELSENHIFVLADITGGDKTAMLRQLVLEAKSLLTLATAVGWNEQVRVDAATVLDAISKLEGVGFAAIGAIQNGNPNQHEIMDRLTNRGKEARVALESFRQAVAGY